MHHEVEDHIDIERAGAEEAEAVRLKKHGRIANGFGGQDGGVEPLQMTDLQDAAVFLREGDQLIGLRKRGGDGFFNEEIDAGLKECGRYLKMSRGGNADGCGIQGKLTGSAGLEQLVNGAKDLGRIRMLGEGIT
jgi:hypothetical protein